MTGKWTNLKAATDFQNFKCISNRLVVERLQLYIELLENITFCVSFNLTFRNKTCMTKIKLYRRQLRLKWVDRWYIIKQAGYIIKHLWPFQLVYMM